MNDNQITEDLIRALTRMGMESDKIRKLEAEIVTDVRLARLAGGSWRLIGTALGTSAQAAWEKYRTTHPEQPMDGQDQLNLELGLAEPTDT